MALTILETPIYLFEAYMGAQGDKYVCLRRKPNKRGIMLTSDETECFLNDYANWHGAMEPHYLACMLWEAHAMPILNQIDAKGYK